MSGGTQADAEDERDRFTVRSGLSGVVPSRWLYVGCT